MQGIAESELIIDKRGAVYHIGVRPEEIAQTIILVGDPDRVPVVSKHFDSIEFSHEHREFITHTGMVGKKRITVLSTGIGTDNIDIAMNELDALVNIDFEKRTIKESLTTLNIFRLGTSGSLQANVPVDTFVAGSFGLGIDNVMHFYETKQTIEEQQIISAFKEFTGLNSGNVIPYIFSCSKMLLTYFSQGYHQGITVGCPGFYGPQGRILRLRLAYKQLVDNLTDFKLNDFRIANFEMESSAIYGLGRMLGHECLSLNAIVANRVAKTFSKDPAGTVEKLISQSLQNIERI